MSNRVHWEEQYHNQKERWIKPDEEIVDIASTLEPGSALDLGAGEGGNSFWLARMGYTFTSVEWSNSATQFIQDYAIENDLPITAIEEDVLLFCPSQKFDLIVVSFVHFTFSDRDVLLRNISAMLKPGGSFVYIGLVKKVEELPPGASLDEFPSSNALREQVNQSDLVIETCKELERVLPTGISTNYYTANTLTLWAKKGR